MKQTIYSTKNMLANKILFASISIIPLKYLLSFFPMHMLIMEALHHQFVRIYPVVYDHHEQQGTDLQQNHTNLEKTVILHIP